MPLSLLKKMNPIIRLATNKDIDEIMEIVHDAKELLRQSGSMQWNDKIVLYKYIK